MRSYMPSLCDMFASADNYRRLCQLIARLNLQDNHEFKYIPYNRLFDRLDRITIPHHGKFVGYPNRDSLSYKKTYGLDGIATLYRGTLRRPNFCKGFNVFIELGMTDDSFPKKNAENLTPRDLLSAFLPYIPNLSVEQMFIFFLGHLENALYPLQNLIV